MYDGAPAATNSAEQSEPKTRKPFKGETNPKKAFIYHPRKKGHRPASVDDIWQLIKRGKSRNDIRKRFYRLNARHIDAAESFMMENHRPEYCAVMGESGTAYRVWIDECVRWQFGSLLHKLGYGKVRSVVQSDKSGTKDPHLWRFLIRKQADLVITRDGRDFDHKDDKFGMKLEQLSTQHLTTLARKSREPSLCAQWYRGETATKAKRFPFVLIIDSSVKDHSLARLLEIYKDDILTCVAHNDERIYARLGHDGLHSLRTVENVKMSELEPRAVEALRQIDEQEGLPFSSPRSYFTRTHFNTEAERLIYDGKKEKALAKYQAEREDLMEAIIAFAKAKNMIVDITLARFVIELIYTENNDIKQQNHQSSAPSEHLDRLVHLRHASLG